MTSANVQYEGGCLTRILLDPLSYVHPERLQLPISFDTPRHRAVVNQMLIDKLTEDADEFSVQSQLRSFRLLHFWSSVPHACTLIGAQLLKSELTWKGRLLGLPKSIRVFLDLPLHRTMLVLRSASTDIDMTQGNRRLASLETEDLMSQIQGVGLSCFLDCLKTAPPGLIGRMRLMFSPRLDVHFDQPRRQADLGELFLISQALHYAKNHSNHA